MKIDFFAIAFNGSPSRFAALPGRALRHSGLAMLVLISGLAAGCGQSPEVSLAAPESLVPPGPEVSSNSIWRPFFFTDVGDQPIHEIVGTGFGVKVDDHESPLLVTSLSLLGPEGGLTAAIEPERIDQAVREVIINEAFGVSDSVIQMGVPLRLDPARAGELPWSELGVVIVPADHRGKRIRPLPFADSSPEVGETIWLATAVFGGAPASQTVHESVVTARGDQGQLRYRFVNPRLNLHAAAGAPLLNDDGEVVAMHQADTSADEVIAGTGVTAELIRAAIQRLLAAEPEGNAGS